MEDCGSGVFDQNCMEVKKDIVWGAESRKGQGLVDP